jgi:hypothetical protein
MTDESAFGTDRRTFIKQSTVTMLAAGMSAQSYARILGANDRIRLAQIGCGGRSHGHVHMAQLASRQIPVETVLVAVGEGAKMAGPQGPLCRRLMAAETPPVLGVRSAT